MNLAGLSAVYPGFQAAQQQDLRTKQMQAQQQDAQDEQMSLAALGRAFGAPQPPPPQGAGQPSVPQQQAPQPQMPPNAGAEFRAQDFPAGPSMPNQPAPPGAGAQFRPQDFAQAGGGGVPQARPTMAGGQPMQQSGPSQGGGQPMQPQGGQPPSGGMMNLQQLTQRIIAANPGIEKNPRVLIKAMERGQVLLAPEGKAELAAAKQQLAAQALDMKMQQFEATLAQKQATQLTAQEKMQLQSQILDAKRENLQIAQAGLDRRGAEARDARFEVLLATIAGRKDLQGQKDTAADKRLGLTLDNKTAIAAAHDEVRKELGDTKNLNDAKKIEGTQWYQKRMTDLKAQGLADNVAKAQADHEVKLLQEQGRNTRAQSMNLGKLTQMATKAGVTITDDMDASAIQKATAAKMAEKADSLKPDPETVAFLAASARQDPSLLSRLGRNDSLKKAVYDALAKLPGIDSGTLASAKVALGEKQEAGRVVGRIEGSTRQALEEMAPFSKLVRASAAKVDNTKYPTVNAIVQAAKRGTGDPDIITLGNNIAALKRAFTQAMARGGVSSVDAQRRADELISGTMAPKQLDAAINAMTKEAEGIMGAAGRATKGIAEEAGGKKAPESTPAAGGAEDDPYGLLK